jgi:hypothetical protein
MMHCATHSAPTQETSRRILLNQTMHVLAESTMRWTKELYIQLRLFAYFVDQWSRNYSHFWK